MIPLDNGCLADFLAQMLEMSNLQEGVLKIILSRGVGGRGYRLPEPTHPTYCLAVFPPSRNQVNQQGIYVRVCSQRLVANSSLAGIKHLNRLEQVLARAEWHDPQIDEGLLRDADDRVIGATAGNLFIVSDGELLTPRIDRCGVAGVARAWLLARARRWLPVAETDIDRAQVESADEVFLSNAVRGVMPVAGLGRRRWQPGPVTMRLGYTLAALGIGRAPGVYPQ